MNVRKKYFLIAVVIVEFTSTCSAIHRPAHAIFGGKKHGEKSSKSKFFPEHIVNLPYVSALSNADLKSIPCQIKPHISKVAIGMMFASWPVNKIRNNTPKTKTLEPKKNETSLVNFEDASVKNTSVKNTEPPPPCAPPLAPTETETKNDCTRASVIIRFNTQGVNDEVEHGVCNSTFVSQDINEITIKEGEVVTIHSKAGAFWWYGTNYRGQKGMFPASNVVTIKKNHIL